MKEVRMKPVVVSRRQVLQGAKGFTLALPFLPSLVPVKAYAATAVIARQPRFVSFCSNHGGVLEKTMYPADAVLTQSMQLYTEHAIRWGTHVPSNAGGDTALSEIARAPSNKLTPALVAKINIIRGLDVPWYIAHNTGGHLGNYARNDGNGGDGQAVQSKPTPTIDQLLAYSNKFYTTQDGIRLRAMITGNQRGLTWNFSNPAARTGTIQEIKGPDGVKNLFNMIFDPAAVKPPANLPPPRQTIVDRVLANYKGLKESNKRLSKDDRQRLDDHMQRIAELQMRVGARQVVRSAACKDVKDPGEPTGRAKYQAINDVIAAAFMCGTSRIAVVGVRENEFASNGANWHQGVAHLWDSSGQGLLVEANRNIFSQVYVDLLSKLEVEDQPGQTLLDNSFVTWTNESGQETHDARSRPTFTAGSGAGAFKTGLYIDYRNMAIKGRIRANPSGTQGAFASTGLTHSQFLATILQAYGLPRSDWQSIPNNGKAGYGNDFVAADYLKAQAPQVMANASDPLPVLSA